MFAIKPHFMNYMKVWQDEIKELEVKAANASEEAKSKISIKIEELKEKRDTVSQKLHTGSIK